MRGPSMSSMRRMIFHPFCRASIQLIRNVRALPRCSAPVGEGASRVVRISSTGRGLIGDRIEDLAKQVFGLLVLTGGQSDHVDDVLTVVELGVDEIRHLPI